MSSCRRCTDSGTKAGCGALAEQLEHQRLRSTLATVTHPAVVCFLNADDSLSPDYLQAGMQCFDRYGIGIGYSDMDRFERESITSDIPDDVSLASFEYRDHQVTLAS